ncbi:MAG: HAD-IC family P-type ATPase, partial [Rhodoferax sp.]
MASTPLPSPAPSSADWHLREVQELVHAHGVDPANGLQEHQVAERALRYGANALPTQTRRSLWTLLVEQFRDVMILVLVAAALISGAMGDRLDTLVILVIVLLNATVGLLQAWRADQALAALQRLAAAQATVLRSGQVRQVPAQALVPGDIVLLEAGNQVPADLRLIEIAQLRMDESALTGESVTVDKHAGVLRGAVHALGDRLNMAFKGTTATHGRGRGLVVATGVTTELGKVAGLLEQKVDRSTPLQLRLAAFGTRVALAVLGICAVIFVVGV